MSTPHSSPPRARRLGSGVRARRSSPPGSRSRGGCHPATTGSRFSTCRTRATADACCARRTGAGATSAASGTRRPGRCSSAASVDDAITLYYRRILEHGEHLSLDQVKDAYWDGWKAAAEAEREQLGIAWEDDLHEDRAFKLGLDAIDLTFAQLVPQLGEPVAVQRKVEYTLAPGLGVERALLPRPRNRAAGCTATQVPAVVDYKVKTTPLTPVQGRPRLPARRVPRRALARGRPGFQAR